MKNNKRQKTLSAALAAILGIGALCGATVLASREYNEEIIMMALENEQYEFSRIRGMELDEIIAQMAIAAGSGGDYSPIFYYANVFYERVQAGKVSEGTLIGLAKNPLMPDVVRTTVIQVCRKIGIYPQSFDKMLYSEKTRSC
ncbi:MAG: hypothetical protein FWG30_07115 [Eubacteriaceae bacterium]|nr:hypothetical protein [Eubacteriaceae bacterium]